jgi:hypothetical protein
MGLPFQIRGDVGVHLETTILPRLRPSGHSPSRHVSFRRQVIIRSRSPGNQLVVLTAPLIDDIAIMGRT